MAAVCQAEIIKFTTTSSQIYNHIDLLMKLKGLIMKYKTKKQKINHNYQILNCQKQLP